MNQNQISNLEPLCDTGRPSGLTNLVVWSLAFLAIWGLLIAGAWQLLSSHYQEQANEASSPATSLIDDNRH